MTDIRTPETPPPAYQLTIRPTPSDVPAEVRVRRLLKVMLRSFDLRCTSIQLIETPDPEKPNG